MNRTTINFGIDLGTTNSSIALLEGCETRVIENNQGQKYTPSAVWIDRKNRLYVGRQAKNKIESDPEDAYSEFKLQMGSSQVYSFKSSGRVMKPEELSAEVIKSLREDVQQRTGEDIESAVITVPAAFDLPQCEATQRAGKLAGFQQCPLLQEPVAAALAYGFQSESPKTFWLVYDLGGGTFDAAVIRVDNGSIQVVNHGGDNHLGGKLMDWEIVERLFVPALRREFSLSDFERGNPKWRTAFAKLKIQAEEAKIALSRDESTLIYIDPLCQDDRGDWIPFEYELNRRDLEPLCEPYIERSVNICKDVLAEEMLGSQEIAKVILVGGPTLNPFLREILQDRLGIELEYRLDPLTVVAQGAAVFAGTQRLLAVESTPLQKGQYSIELDYKPIDSDPEPLVAGKLKKDRNENMAGWSVELVETKSLWRSGLITLSPQGYFLTTLRAEKGRTNEFLIELKNEQGHRVSVVPDRFTYTLGATISSQPLIHSIGVALANNETRVFLEKGCELPARRREILQTTSSLKRGETGTFLQIPVVEGENTSRADRNQLIGNLIVTGDKVRRDVLAGSEVEITIVVDESRQVHTIAYIPVLDEEYEEVLFMEKAAVNYEELLQDFHQEKKRLEHLRKTVAELGDSTAQSTLVRLEREHVLQDIEVALSASSSDGDAADKCQSRLLYLKRSLDEIEKLIEWPDTANKAMQRMRKTEQAIIANRVEEQMSIFRIIQSETERALESRDLEKLKNQIRRIDEFHTQILISQPQYWVQFFNYLCQKKDEMSNSSYAQNYFEQGERAFKNQDIHLLESSVRHLVSLLPVVDQDEVKHLNSTVMPFAQ